MIVNNPYSPIFVTGIQRSGSTIVANVLRVCGAYPGLTSTMMENVYLMDYVDNYYNSIHKDPRGQFPLPDPTDLPHASKWKDDINKLWERQAYRRKKGPWLYKGSRICQTWPVWYSAFPEGRYIIVRRRTGDVLNSCKKTAYMNAFEREDVQSQINVSSVDEGWLWWVHEQEKRQQELIDTQANHMIIWPDRILEGDYTQMKKMVEWVGLKWTDRAIEILDNALKGGK